MYCGLCLHFHHLHHIRRTAAMIAEVKLRLDTRLCYANMQFMASYDFMFVSLHEQYFSNDSSTCKGLSLELWIREANVIQDKKLHHCIRISSDPHYQPVYTINCMVICLTLYML